MNRITKLSLALVLVLPVHAFAQQIVDTSKSPPANPAPGGASVHFAELKDGDVVPKSFRVKFRVTGMKVRPAGTAEENSGHHHLLVDLDELPPLDQPLPANESIYHFGKGQKSAVITMPPGEHTLQLLFADYMHVPHDPPVMSEKITITVSE